MIDHRLLMSLIIVGLTASRPLSCADDRPPYCYPDALNTESGPDAYVLRDGTRCEGIYRLKLAGGSERLLLRSLTSARSDAPLGDQSKLEVSWAKLPSGIRLRVSVVPLDSPVLYRMDADADGAAGVFRWPARIAQSWFSTYRNLGVTAFYVQDGRTVHVPCILGKPSASKPEGLRADLLSLEPISLLEVYSRACDISRDCDSMVPGSPAAALPGRDRDGTFTIKIDSSQTPSSDYYSLKFVATLTYDKKAPMAKPIVVRATPPGSPK